MFIREAKPSDKSVVLGFCKATFSWGDYISQVWDNWFSEGNLLVLTENQIPIAICHVSVIKEKQIWIEGIRVNQNFRRKGCAKSLIKKSELIGRKNNCKISKMLIETNNINSLNLARSQNYFVEEKWNFYSLLPKKIEVQNRVNFAKNKSRITKYLRTSNHYFVRSWRWFPLTKSALWSLIEEKRVLLSEDQNKINALAILIESDHFEKTLMVTLVFGDEKGINDILTYIQNLSHQKGYTRIQILTKKESITKHDNLEKKFSFYLMKKDF